MIIMLTNYWLWARIKHNRQSKEFVYVEKAADLRILMS